MKIPEGRELAFRVCVALIVVAVVIGSVLCLVLLETPAARTASVLALFVIVFLIALQICGKPPGGTD